jgi:hypothetical protein
MSDQDGRAQLQCDGYAGDVGKRSAQRWRSQRGGHRCPGPKGRDPQGLDAEHQPKARRSRGDRAEGRPGGH